VTNIEVEVQDESSKVPCGRCGGEIYLWVKVPRTWELSDGRTTEGGWRAVQLCPRCDASWPSAQGILAYFVMHDGRFVDTNLEAFVEVLTAWLDDLPPFHARADEIASEEAAYNAGLDPDERAPR
jgi:hypothetical protein